MNDLTQYYSVRHLLRAGDVIVFYGAGLLDKLIEVASEGPGHSAVVRWGAMAAADVVVEESTINGKRNGVQHNPLGWELAGYPVGSSAAALLLSDAVRAQMNLEAFYAYIGQIDGILRYDIPGLFKFLLPQAFDRIEPTKEMVCSVTVGAILAKCGAIRNVNWGRMRPQDLVELGIYKTFVPLLGEPKLHNFNTI